MAFILVYPIPQEGTELISEAIRNGAKYFIEDCINHHQNIRIV